MKLNYMSFADARSFVRSMGFMRTGEFRAWATGKRPELPPKPPGLPSNPHHVYPDEFLGYTDFLGTRNKATYRRQFLPFEEARAFVRSLGLETHAQWSLYSKGKMTHVGVRPENIPSNPWLTYRRKGWLGTKDWLGSGAPSSARVSHMRPFEQAREFARGLNLTSWKEWRKYVRGELRHLPAKPWDVPAIPSTCYHGRGWISYGDFLGCNTVAWHSSEWMPYEQAKEQVRKLCLPNLQAWRRWHRAAAPNTIPYNPDKAYRDRWEGWPAWLGKH